MLISVFRHVRDILERWDAYCSYWKQPRRSSNPHKQRNPLPRTLVQMLLSLTYKSRSPAQYKPTNLWCNFSSAKLSQAGSTRKQLPGPVKLDVNPRVIVSDILNADCTRQCMCVSLWSEYWNTTACSCLLRIQYIASIIQYIDVDRWCLFVQS